MDGGAIREAEHQILQWSKDSEQLGILSFGNCVLSERAREVRKRRGRTLWTLPLALYGRDQIEACVLTLQGPPKMTDQIQRLRFVGCQALRSRHGVAERVIHFTISDDSVDEFIQNRAQCGLSA